MSQKDNVIKHGSENPFESMKQRFDQAAKIIGLDIAKLAQTKKVTKVVFDRSGYLYTGVIKTLADSAREGGLEF